MPLDSWNKAADQVNIGGFYPTVDQTWTPRGEVQLSSSGIVTVQFQTLCCLLDVGWGVETTFHCQQETTCIVFTVRVLLPACECVIIAAIAEALLSTSIRCFLYLSVWETCGQIWWRWLHRCGAAYCIKTCVGKRRMKAGHGCGSVGRRVQSPSHHIWSRPTERWADFCISSLKKLIF